MTKSIYNGQRRGIAMLSKIKVYGRLARFLGERSFEAEISTPLHAFKFLLANFPHLERHMIEQNYVY